MSALDKEDSATKKVPLSERESWIVPATIFGGLEFAVPVIMVGSTLIGSFSLYKVLLILLIGLVIIQWVGNSLQGYLGAATGRASSVIARSSFGSIQARFVVGLALVVLNVGWFGINTAVAGEAIAATIGLNYTEQWLGWALITLLAGILFALPAVIGYSSMKWTDYLAVPAGLILIITAVFFALKGTGWDAIMAWNPQEKAITMTEGISLVLGANVAQWLIASDFTRYSKPKVKDQILIPLGIVVTGMVFFLTGAVMAVGRGEPDIVIVMQDLGFPFWGFLILWLALWTSQIVASYSIGLAASNMLNIHSGKGRSILTLVGSLLGVILAIAGILNFFTEFLTALAVIYPAIFIIMVIDFFFFRNQKWENNYGWNWLATLAFLSGSLAGYITQYVVPIGIPPLFSLAVSAIVYVLAMKIKNKYKPDKFTQANNVEEEAETI